MIQLSKLPVEGCDCEFIVSGELSESVNAPVEFHKTSSLGVVGYAVYFNFKSGGEVFTQAIRAEYCPFCGCKIKKSPVT